MARVIHAGSKAISTADIFDALTAYRAAEPVSKAFDSG